MTKESGEKSVISSQFPQQSAQQKKYTFNWFVVDREKGMWTLPKAMEGVILVFAKQ